MTDKIYKIAGGEVVLWVEPGCSVMLKVVSKSPDPIELGGGEVEELIAALTKLKKAVDGVPE